MSTLASTVVTNLLDRVRDPGGLGTSNIQPPSLANGQAFALTLLSIAQRQVNCAEQNQLTTVPWASTPYQTTYHIDSDPILGTGGTAPIMKLIGIQNGTVDLLFSPFAQLWQSDFGWFRATTSGGPPHTWSLFGHDVFIIYPAMTRAYNFTLIAVPYLTDLTMFSTLAITDDLVPEMLDLAEALALFKLGEYKLAATAVERMGRLYQINLEGGRWRKPGATN